MESTENRNIWYNNAELWEIDFVNRYGNKLGVIINPSKSVSKFAPDLFILKNSTSADLKLLNIPFYTSEKSYNIVSQHCWTFNVSDLFDYSIKYSDNFGIFIWKTFVESFQYGIKIEKEESIYYCTLGELKKIILKSGKIHEYIRRMNDTNGNAYGSYAIDLRNITKINM